MNNIQKDFKAKAGLRGMANGGVYKSDVNGVPTFTDGRARAPDAQAYVPGSGKGTVSFISNPTATPQVPPRAQPNMPPSLVVPPVTAAAKVSPLAQPAPRPVPPPPVMAPPPVPPPTQLPTMTVTAPTQLPTMTITAPPQVAPLDLFAESGLRRPSKISSYYDNESETEFADGGKVTGKGGPTDDAIGPVMLSNGEYVLPADTVEAVGRDKLDALRDATHTFVKPKSGLRGMANGGELMPRTPQALVPYRPPVAAPAPSRLAGLARGSFPIAAAIGAAQSFDDVGSGYRDQFNASVGLDGVGSSVTSDAARVADNVGNAITFGVAGRLGRGIANLAGGQSFSDGFMSEAPRDAYMRQQNQLPVTTTNSQPISRGNAPLSQVPEQMSAQQPSVPVQSPKDNSAVQDSLLRTAGRVGTASVGGLNTTDARKINAHYDDMLRNGAGQSIMHGLDWSQRHGLDVERARASALGENGRLQASLRGQDISAANASNNAISQARQQAISTLGGMANQRTVQAQNAQSNQLKALLDAQKQSGLREEKGFDRYTDAIGSMFVTTDSSGKQAVDKAAQEQFRAFIEGSDPKAGEKFAAMGPQQQQVLLQNFKVMFDMQQERNKTALRGSGGVSNRMDLPVDVREATWNDYWNNGLPLSDYAWSNLPFTNRNVVELESGQPVLYEDFTSTNGASDLDKKKLVNDAVRSRKSALRGN